MSNLTDEREYLPSSLESVVATILAFGVLEEKAVIPEAGVLDEKSH